MKRLPKKKAILGWYVSLNYGKFNRAHDKQLVVKKGVIQHCTKEIMVCINGLHSSKNIYDAIYFGLSSPLTEHNSNSIITIARTKSWGFVEFDSDKLASEYREILYVLTANQVLALMREHLGSLQLRELSSEATSKRGLLNYLGWGVQDNKEFIRELNKLR